MLPLIYENVRADTSSKGSGPFPFEQYYDIEKLRTIAPVVSLGQLERTGVPCNRMFFTNSKHFKATARRIPRLIKQHYTKIFLIKEEFVDEDRVSASRHHTCWDDSLCPHSDFSHFGPYSEYKVGGQGYDITRSRTLLTIREAFQPAPSILEIARSVLKSINGPFNALHLRRGDFASKCAELPSVCDEYGYNAFVQTKEFIAIKLESLNQPKLPLFVTTTHKEDCQVLLYDLGVPLFFLEDEHVPPAQAWALNRTDILSVASQVVASEAEEFIGNRFSSFTTEVNNMRYLKGRREARNFF